MSMLPNARSWGGSSDHLVHRMADGTVKQLNPFTGLQVWTVPGRADRPLSVSRPEPVPLTPGQHTSACAFCSDRYAETPPEKERLVRYEHYWDLVRGTPYAELHNTLAEFRRIPNLFEIVSFDYWQKNYEYELTEEARGRMVDYLADPSGREHVLGLLKVKIPEARRAGVTDDELLEQASAFFGGAHDVIIARRHYLDDADNDHQLASSGTLSVDEHRRYTHFTIGAMRDLYSSNRYARYVAVFQNWLTPAGASFDHLHKQLVAIDERGVQAEMELARVRENPNIYNEAAVNYASYHNLIIAENDHAIAFAGFGHRYPTLEVFSKSERSEPWNHSMPEIIGMSDLIHAMHAATGADVACNEEWHYKPPDADVSMPWRVMIKWRLTTVAGFEGGTKVYLNTIDPVTLRDRVVPRLYKMRDDGHIDSSIRIAEECACLPNCLRYNPAVRPDGDENQAFPPLGI